MSMPINGFVESVRCYHCGEINQLGVEFWQHAIERDNFAEALAGAEGEATDANVMSRYGNYQLAYGKRAPRCQACKGPDLDVNTLAGFVEAGRCFCPACGHQIRVRNADALVRAINDRAVGVVHETAALGGEHPMEARTQPVLFQCMGCGGGLTVDGSSRAVSCQFCNQSNYLPDGLWRQLNPVPKPAVFFLICHYDEASAQALRWSSEETRAADAATSQDPNALAQLAKYDEEDVRKAVAANPATPPQVLWDLATDDGDEVLEALCARADLPWQICDRLSAHTDDQTRQRIARHPNLPYPTLKQLAKDDDSDVQAAAQAQLRVRRG